MYMDIQKLIGKVIKTFSLTEQGEKLTLHTNAGSIVFRTKGDCCSESWIEHINAPKLPAIILGIESKDLGECEGTRQEYDKKYSTIFKTSMGDFEVVFTAVG
jgi:hypothetical protein